MKVLGLVGSPRKGSNTDLVVSEVLSGAESSEHSTEKVYLYSVDILPCIDCRVCKQGSFSCALHDGMQQLYPKLEDADAIVFGTPLYWYGPSAKMKLLIDRLRPYIASKKLKGKKAVIVVPSEEGAEACKFVAGMFDLSFEYLEMELVVKLLPKASEKAEVKQQPVTIQQAFAVGKAL